MNRPGSQMAIARAAIALATLALFPATASAQGLVSRSGDTPVTIHAEQGIEWDRDGHKYIARGNAVATRNQASVRADVLTAYYRDKPGNKSGGKPGNTGQDIFRVDATGNVRITTNDQTAFGDTGVYTVDQAVFVLKGKKLRLLSKQGILTARDSLEYWEAKRLAVARGNAVLVKEDRRLHADILTAHLAEKEPSAGNARGKPAGASGESDVRQVDAFGNVHISLRNAIVKGDRGVYIPRTGIATVCGNVRITSGKNQLNGECAEVNLNTSIYRLTGRAQGLVIPKQKSTRK